MDWLQGLSAEMIAQHWTVWLAVLTAVLYLLLAARENPWCWFWGIISCSFWAYAAFALYDLWVDALLQLFYVGISFYGVYEWRWGGRGGKDLPITTMSWQLHLWIIAGGLLLSYLIGYLFKAYTPAAATYIDAFTTTFSVIITFMVIYKKLENWAYWLVVDTVYVYLYWSRGGYLFALLFIVYLIIVIIGWINWTKVYQKEGPQNKETI
ncbi:MAG: nicotinamide mononucleotide transporter [Phaeodactylibacter sp.]|nr:nicotinamide mononucleotide transporter [Phaeodactylibacter sp.]